MRKLKSYLAIALCLFGIASVGRASVCNEYRIFPSQKNISTEITHKAIEKQGHSGESQQENSEDKSEVGKGQGEKDNSGNNAESYDLDAKSVSNDASNKIERYSKESYYEKVNRFLGITYGRTFGRFFDWLKGLNSDAWAVIVAAMAVIFAFFAWLTSREGLKESKKANILQLQPYITLEYVDHELLQSDARELNLQIRIKIINSGQTPAYNMIFEYDAASSSVGIENIVQYSLPTMQNYRTTAPNFPDRINILSANESQNLVVVLRCRYLNGEYKRIFEHARIDQTASVGNIILNHVSVRYKDYDTLGRDVHHLMRARVLERFGMHAFGDGAAEGDPRRTRITNVAKPQNDAEHEHFREFPDIRN